MKAPGVLHRMGDMVRGFFLNGEREEIESLKKEILELRDELEAARAVDRSAVHRAVEVLRTDIEAGSDKDGARFKQEIEIIRNEMQENIAAIHRLEILTLPRRIKVLNDFGKALPPTYAGRTRKSLKPHGYSFGIITNGQRNEKLARLVASIRSQGIPPEASEILVAGRVDELRIEGIRTFPMNQAADEGRLGAMRNVLAKEASFNKFVSLDDDFLLHPQWSDAVEEVKGDFDVATSIIVNPDLTRYCDWVNNIENYTFLRPYHETFDKCQYMTGGYGIYKDFIFLEHSWNDDLGFYQGEDVSFSRRLFAAGYELKFIAKAIVMHDDERYRQKGYGVIRLQPADECPADHSLLSLKIEKLCPRTLS